MRHAIRDHYGSTVEVIRAEESAKKKKKKKGDAHQSTFARMHVTRATSIPAVVGTLMRRCKTPVHATPLLLQRALSLDAYIPRESCRARSRDV